MKVNGGGGQDLKLAPFATTPAAPADAEMWPAHPAAWLELELQPVVPASSGLRVERYNTLPSPGPIEFGHAPANPGPKPLALPPLRAPELRAHFPQSGLEPLGWEPRASSRKGDR